MLAFPPRQAVPVFCLAVALLIITVGGATAATLNNGRVFLSYGHVKLDMDKFNDRLISRGMLEYETGFNSLGVGMYTFVNNRWSVGADLSILLDNNRRVGVYSASVAGTYGGVNIGYLAYRFHGLNIQPQLTVDGGAVNLDIAALTAQSPTSPLGDGRGSVEMSSVQAAVGVMLAIDYLWVMGRTEEGTDYGLVLGTSIGYQFSPWQSDWESTGVDLFDEPGIKFQGPKIRFSAGFGWDVE